MQLKTPQYNCKTCEVQGDNSLVLKQHIQRTEHVPNEHDEKCYTCKKVFQGYFQLMNHRKLEHPSTKQCRYF